MPCLLTLTDSPLCRHAELLRVILVIMRLMWLSFCCHCWLVADVSLLFFLTYVFFAICDVFIRNVHFD